ncbi:phage tail assembly chaperone [Paracoccus sp. MBLB3053]|uniref:Phage tail assembly chaperone n=1 Tax=Paracoccus aurantius TaxID=3073814 RepID=A0ABU2HLU3_9RHOB|nr:phage tail assembly chaperone [Paracoccus sp. MBLB3053]MDS9466016.1 phage tail assembly chaperone [Paracoccus sp. MBLB3053]
MSRRSLDWAGLIRVGMGPSMLGGLGLQPAVFWALTPAELAAMLGVVAGEAAMTRSRLAELAALYPDAQSHRED